MSATDVEPRALSAHELTELQGRVEGRVVTASDLDYEDVRKIWNGMIKRRPAAIVLCSGSPDVIAALHFARSRRLPLSIRSGGHNVSGSALCEGGLVIDLGRMKGMQVDPKGQTAVAQPGLRWGEFDRECQAAGLATTAGIVTDTGLAGLTVGGGIGWLMRKHALTCDNLTGADVVTAGGQLLHASADENDDLFWGIRGGGGNFGIVTSFEFNLHALGPMVMAGFVLHPARIGRDALRFYRDFAASAPPEVTTIVTLRRAPPLPSIPKELHGEPVVSLGACFAGSVDAGERALAPLKRFGPPLLDLIHARPYLELQATFDASVPSGLLYYWKSAYTGPWTDAAIDTLVEHGWQFRAPASYTIAFQMGGAVQAIDEDASAFGGRNAAHAVNINCAAANDGDAEHDTEWTRRFFDALQPHSTGGTYVNFISDEDRVKDVYGREKLARLVALKDRYDPDNVFRLNQNIKPSIR
ncbi:MAG TPA: FAD-binding oxidoreductase [Candidatus Dormibacteraeota bacterium]|jgi:FAD/FMN-containing dehydrogenase